jgi:Protein of unknown function (DUF3619)
MNRKFADLGSLELEALESRFAFRVAGRLSDHAGALGADIGERLRFAREQALVRAAAARTALSAETRVLGQTGGSALLGGGSSWWVRVASVLPLVVLVGGLLLIQHWQTQAQIAVAAEVDAALLADDLPPEAYGDAGFVEFLKTPPN